MLQQNGQHVRQQTPSSAMGNYMNPASNGFDPSNMFNLDPASSGTINAAGMIRNGSGTNVPSLSAGGGTAAPFLGGVTSMNAPIPSLSAGLETANPVSISGSNGRQNFNHLPSNQQPESNSMSQPLQPTRNMTQAAQANALAASKQRLKSFLSGLANVMASRGTPLPPQLTGVPYPAGYDPSNSPWKALELSQEIGSFRLAGKDISLFKLWGIVIQAGGAQKITDMNAWSGVLLHFGLADNASVTMNGQISLATTLGNCYMAILAPFDEMYKKSLMDSQRRAQMASQQPGAMPQPTPAGVIGQGRPSMGLSPSLSGQTPGAGMGGMMNMNAQKNAVIPPTSNSVVSNVQILPNPVRPPSTAQSVHHSDSGTPQPSVATSSDTHLMNSNGLAGPMADKDLLDADGPGMKRKLDSEEADNKRARQRMAGSEPDGTASTPVASLPFPENPASATSEISNVSSTSQHTAQAGKRKITYLPVNREVETYGGRDLNLIDEELLRTRRPLREIHDWGVIDIDHLTMSIRSGLAPELAYGLTTFTIVSTMRGQTQGSGFPIKDCWELLDEVLDLIEDEAFDGERDTFDPSLSATRITPTHRELLRAVQEEGTVLFTSLCPRQGAKPAERGPLQRKANIVLAVMNILRNLSLIQDNVPMLAAQMKMLDVILRVCEVTKDGADSPPRAVSTILSLSDVMIIRKDVLYILSTLGQMVHFHQSISPSSGTRRIASRAFDLLSSYLVDTSDAISPMSIVHLSSHPQSAVHKPPLIVDLALEVFTKLAQNDSNRLVFSKSVSKPAMRRLFDAFVHRLPIVEVDFQLFSRETWLSYLEKLIMAMYSLAFIMPPDVKEEIKSDTKLGFSKVLFRMIRKFALNANAESRIPFMVCVKRAIETMKVIDDSGDSFGTPKSTGPVIGFGMGYGEVGEDTMDKGTGILGGRRELTWDLLMMREMDETMFAELDTLRRIE